MKNKEEIEKLTNDYSELTLYKPKNAQELRDVNLIKIGFKNGYTQCQQDIVELLRVEIHRAFIHGQGNAQMMEAGLERDEVEEYVNWRMLSLNKQD